MALTGDRRPLVHVVLFVPLYKSAVGRSLLSPKTPKTIFQVPPLGFRRMTVTSTNSHNLSTSIGALILSQVIVTFNQQRLQWEEQKNDNWY